MALAMFFAGVFFMGYLGSNIPVFIVLISFFLFICSDFLKLKTIKNTVVFVLTGVVFFCFGVCYFNYSYQNFSNNTAAYENSFKENLSGTVSGDIYSTLESQSFTLKTKDGLKVNVTYLGDMELLPGDIVEIPELYLKKVNIKNTSIPFNVSLISDQIPFYASYRGDDLKIRGEDSRYLLQRTFYKIRKNSFFTLLKYLDYDEAAFSYSLISSDKAYISNELYDKLVKSGLLHLCTVSGFHFTFLCIFLIFLTAGIVKPYRPRIFIIITAASFFVLYTGFSPSVLRAYIMFFAVKICDLMYIEHISPKLTLLFTAVFFTVINPFVIYDYSFILTFCAMAGLVFVSPFLREKFIKGEFFGKGYIVSALSVNIVMLPVCYSLFGRITLWGFVTNFFAEAAIALLMILIILVSAISGVFSALGVLLSPLLKVIIKYIFLLMSVSKLNFNIKILFYLPLEVAVILVIALYFLLKGFLSDKKRKKAFASVFLCVAVMISFYTVNFSDNNAYITYVGSTNGVDVIYKNKHYVFCNIKDLEQNPQSFPFRQNEKIRTLFIMDSRENSASTLESFVNTYNIDEIYVNEKMYSYLSEENIKFTKNRIKCDNSYKDSFIDILYNEKIEFKIYGKRFVISPDIRYVAYSMEKEKNCTVLFTDYGNIRYRELMNILEFDKSITPVIRSDGYESFICTSEYSMITVTDSGKIYTD